jgi:hypothetical protein
MEHATIRAQGMEPASQCRKYGYGSVLGLRSLEKRRVICIDLFSGANEANALDKNVCLLN